MCCSALRHERDPRTIETYVSYLRMYTSLPAGTHTSHCNAVQHSATQCNTVQHSATQCNTVQHSATQCNTVQHRATQCNTLQHTATHCNTLQHTAPHISAPLPTYNSSKFVCEQSTYQYGTLNITRNNRCLMRNNTYSHH